MLAGSIERWVARFQRQESETVERMSDEVLKVEPELDRAEVRRRMQTRYEKNWELEYRIKYKTETKALFDKAYEMGEIAKEHEQLATRPLAIQFNEVPALFNEIAESLYAAAEAPAAS